MSEKKSVKTCNIQYDIVDGDVFTYTACNKAIELLKIINDN